MTVASRDTKRSLILSHRAMFAHLHGHSQFSLLEAIGSSKAIIQHLKQLGFSHAPLMDYNGMYNAIAHYQLCKKEGIEPIIGVDLTVSVQTGPKSSIIARNLTLIAKNYAGYLLLLQIVSRAQTTPGTIYPHLGLAHFPNLENNILCLVHAYETTIGDMIAQNAQEDNIIHTISLYQEIFGQDNVILEVIPQDSKENHQLAKANKVLRSLHEKTGLPIIAASNFHYILAQDKEAFDIARCIKDGKHVYDDDRRTTQGSFFIADEQQIRLLCEQNGFSTAEQDVLCETSMLIADRIHLDIPLHQLLFPVYETPSDIKDMYAVFSENERAV